MKNAQRSLALSSFALVSVMALTGCPVYGPPPETVDFVDIEQYAGLWYEIASNPVFFNQDLVAVTAEYEVIAPGTVSVLNMGRVGTPDGRERSIQGQARVVDPETNSKLAVRFSTGFFGRLFEGDYWIVLLDQENYEYAVVTDSRQYTLFILYREPAMPVELLDEILVALTEKGVDTSRLELTGWLLE